jgi:UDP-glucose 4-epimerase
MTTRSVLLTGATGFIGRHLAADLHRRGFVVTSLQRAEAAVPGVTETIRVADFTPATLTQALAGRRFDWLLHFASYGVRPDDRDAEQMFAVNVDATRRLVQLAAQWPAKAAFVAGSGSEYDTMGATGPVDEDHPLEYRKLYGASKAAAGLTALAIAEAGNLPLVVGRIFGVYGCGEAPHRLLPSLVRNLSAGNRVPLSAGLQIRDFLHVEDLLSAVRALTEAAEARQIRSIFNIATGDPRAVRCFAEIVAEELGAPASLLGFGDLATRPDETICFSGAPARLMKLTGWAPTYELRSGIRASLQPPSSE